MEDHLKIGDMLGDACALDVWDKQLVVEGLKLVRKNSAELFVEMVQELSGVVNVDKVGYSVLNILV